jgi:glycosyltransferase involved in cell wall biosynthesis
MFSNFAKKYKKNPFIIICPGEDIQKNKKIDYGLRLDPHIDYLVKKYLKHADFLIALTKGIKKEFTKIGISKKNIKEINYGIDEKIYSIKDSKSKIRDNLKIPQNKFIYFCCGRNHPKKNFKILIPAALELKKKYKDFLIMITGKNTEKLIPLIKQNKLEKYFILNNEVSYLDKNFRFPNKKLLLHFKASDAFVFPSNLETFGIVLIEAMACNLPIITSDAEGCVDVIDNGKFGMIFRKNNTKELVSKMIEIRNKKTKLRYKLRSKKRIKDFALSNIILEYRKLLFND